MSVKRLYILSGGSLEIDQLKVPIGKSKDRWLTSPVPFYLIQTDRENILFDTGCNPDAAVKPEETWGSLAKVFVPCFFEEDHPVSRLAEIGLTPADIDCVILSHLHFDHAGGLRFFKGVRVLVQKEEYRFALYPDNWAGGYFQKEFLIPDLKWELLEGDQVLFPGIMAVLAEGHSPGHQALVVDLPDTGTVVLAADSVYMEDNLKYNMPGPGSWNPIRAVHSIKRLKALAERSGGAVFPNHDENFWNSLTKSPGYYT